METSEEIRKWQEAARAAKVRADAQKKIPMQPHEKLVKKEEGKTLMEVFGNESKPPPDPPSGMSAPIRSVADQIVDRKKEAAKRWREKNREKLAADERERRKK
jgi:hypothetical protein